MRGDGVLVGRQRLGLGRSATCRSRASGRSVSPPSFLMRISWNWSSGMVRILVAVSVGAWRRRPASCSTTRSRRPEQPEERRRSGVPSASSAYLLFHQVAMPKPTTPSGKITTLSQNTMFSCCAVMFSGRSSGALGRMEIRSSSDGEPVDHVQEQVAVAVERGPEVVARPHASCRPPRSGPGGRAVVGAGGGQGERTFLVLLGIDADAAGARSGGGDSCCRWWRTASRPWSCRRS